MSSVRLMVRPAVCVFATAVLLLLVSCDLVDLHRLEVQTDPSSANEVVDLQSAIRASFSRPVTGESAERAFLLESEEAEVDVDFVWSDDGFLAAPVETPTPGVRYELRLDGSVIDDRGLDHDIDMYVPFFFGSDSPRPNIESSDPAPGSDIGVFDPLRVRFSLPVDRDRVADALSLSPDTAIEITWHDEDTIAEVTPTGQWEPLTVYRWSISTDAVSAAGVPIPASRSESFVTQSDSSAPDLHDYRFAIRESEVVIETAELHVDGVVLVEFSEAVRFKSVRRAISISPTVSHAVEQVNAVEFLIRFDESLEADRLYEIGISDDLRDLSGNRPLGERSFVIEPVADRQLVSAVRSSWGTASGDGEVDLELNAEIGETTEIGVGSPDGTNTLQFDFGIPYESKEARDRMIDAVELQAVLPERAVNPDIEQIRWLDNGARLRVSFAGLASSESSGEPSIYRLRIASGAASAPDGADGLEQPLVVYLQTEVE